MVFYRKYRPQKISELDSDDVRSKLTSVLSASAPTFLTVPHAFLFTGPKGLGKTSTARIVAKIINCTGRKDKSGKDIEPCNVCDQCVSITNGSNLDVMEIDAASNRGIDEIRDLRDKIRLAPVSSLKKIYIIDEVHMLTTEAFNALLKTLEEPPSHAVFILCTTELHKVPATVMSRCIHITFKKASEKELVRAFERIIANEKISINEKVLKKIAAISDGGFRDGTKVLEEIVLAAGEQEITLEFFEQQYQTGNLSVGLDSFFNALMSKDAKEALNQIKLLADAGISMEYIVEEILKKCEELILQYVSGSTDKFSLHDLTEISQLFGAASKDLKYSVAPTLPLMIAIVKWCEDSSASVSMVTPQKTSQAPSVKLDVTISSLRKNSGNLAKERAVNGDVEEKIVKEKTNPSDVSAMHFAATGEHTQEWLDNLWKNIIGDMKTHNHMIAGVLRSCRIFSYDRKSMIVEASSRFHKERLDEAKTFQLLHEVCHHLIGNPVEITVQLKTN